MSGNIAIGIQDFSTIIQGNYFYIDKTALVYQLVKRLLLKNGGIAGTVRL